MESNELGKNVFVKPFETCHLSKFQKKRTIQDFSVQWVYDNKTFSFFNERRSAGFLEKIESAYRYDFIRMIISGASAYHDSECLEQNWYFSDEQPLGSQSRRTKPYAKKSNRFFKSKTEFKWYYFLQVWQIWTPRIPMQQKTEVNTWEKYQQSSNCWQQFWLKKIR